MPGANPTLAPSVPYGSREGVGEHEQVARYTFVHEVVWKNLRLLESWSGFILYVPLCDGGKNGG